MVRARIASGGGVNTGKKDQHGATETPRRTGLSSAGRRIAPRKDTTIRENETQRREGVIQRSALRN